MNTYFFLMNQRCLNSLVRENPDMSYHAEKAIDAETVVLINQKMQTLSESWTFSRFQLDTHPILLCETYEDGCLENNEIRLVSVEIPPQRTYHSTDPKFFASQC